MPRPFTGASDLAIGLVKKVQDLENEVRRLRSKKEEGGFVRIENADLWILLLSAIRYSMGRRTHMPAFCRQMYHRFKDAFSAQERKQIADEIESELRFYARSTTPADKGLMGSQSEHDEWVALVTEIRADLSLMDGTVGPQA